MIGQQGAGRVWPDFKSGVSIAWLRESGYKLELWIGRSLERLWPSGPEKESMNKVLLFFTALLFLFVGGMGILFASRGLDRNEGQSDIAIHEETDEVIQDAGEPVEFSFVDQNGKRFESKTLDGKLWVGSIFFSSCPSTCRAQNMKVADLQDRYRGKDVEFVSITCDPDVDTPAALNGYAQKFAADAERWHFLTGDLDLIKRVGGNRFGITVDDKVHSDRLVLFDREGNRVDSYRSLEPDQFVALTKELDRRLGEGSDADEATEEPSEG